MFPYVPTEKEFCGEISEIRPDQMVQDPTEGDSKTMYINDSFVLDTIPLDVDDIIDIP